MTNDPTNYSDSENILLRSAEQGRLFIYDELGKRRIGTVEDAKQMIAKDRQQAVEIEIRRKLIQPKIYELVEKLGVEDHRVRNAFRELENLYAESEKPEIRAHVSRFLAKLKE